MPCRAKSPTCAAACEGCSSDDAAAMKPARLCDLRARISCSVCTHHVPDARVVLRLLHLPIKDLDLPELLARLGDARVRRRRVRLVLRPAQRSKHASTSTGQGECSVRSAGQVDCSMRSPRLSCMRAATAEYRKLQVALCGRSAQDCGPFRACAWYRRMCRANPTAADSASVCRQRRQRRQARPRHSRHSQYPHLMRSRSAVSTAQPCVAANFSYNGAMSAFRSGSNDRKQGNKVLTRSRP